MTLTLSGRIEVYNINRFTATETWLTFEEDYIDGFNGELEITSVSEFRLDKNLICFKFT